MEKRGRPSVYSREQWVWIIERYLEGYTCREVADFLGMNAEYLAIKLCKMGIKRGRRHPLLENRRAEFNALRGDDY